MKTLTTLALSAFLTLPVLAGSATTTVPVLDDSEMIEAEEEYIHDHSLDQQRMEEHEDWMEEERMEDQTTIYQTDEMIDYNDRTRTNRARKSLNTSSDASDDQ